MLPSLDRCYDIQYTPNCTYENYQKEKIKSYQMLTYDLEKRGRAPKYAYLYACIRKDILRGVLAPGSRLPSRRELAEEAVQEISILQLPHDRFRVSQNRENQEMNWTFHWS